jgi:hypothetical protein
MIALVMKGFMPEAIRCVEASRHQGIKAQTDAGSPPKENQIKNKKKERKINLPLPRSLLLQTDLLFWLDFLSQLDKSLCTDLFTLFTTVYPFSLFFSFLSFLISSQI